MTDFKILVLDNAYASSVALTLDILAAAIALAPSCKSLAPKYKLYSVGGGEVPLSNGMRIRTHRAVRTATNESSVWVVPGIGMASPVAAASRIVKADGLRASKILAKAAASGATVCAACSAVLLLHNAGLLPNKEVTTAWWLAPQLQQLSPSCKIDANRMVVADGKLVTAGAALAQTDLMLHLVREHFGVKLADAVARVLLIDKRQSQAPFIVPAVYASGNALLAKLSARIESSLPTPPSMRTLASELCVSERTLARRVRAATGRTPLALLQSIRVHKAQSLLENSRLSVDEVAVRVGYQDATALRRLLKLTTQSTPRQMRKSSAR